MWKLVSRRFISITAACPEANPGTLTSPQIQSSPFKTNHSDTHTHTQSHTAISAWADSMLECWGGHPWWRPAWWWKTAAPTAPRAHSATDNLASEILGHLKLVLSEVSTIGWPQTSHDNWWSLCSSRCCSVSASVKYIITNRKGHYVHRKKNMEIHKSFHHLFWGNKHCNGAKIHVFGYIVFLWCSRLCFRSATAPANI